jgi:putative nucleotidyltransferase with HDIG domain
MYDVDFFKEELSWIKDPALQFTTKTALEAAPAWFWAAPASSTGKWHPPDSNGTGGCARHTAKVAWLVYKYAECFGLDSDVLVAAALLHDYDKFGSEDEMELGKDRPHYKHHAEFGAEILQKRFSEFSKDADQLHPDKLINSWHAICACVRSHSGKWGSCPPHTLEQKLVHVADVTAGHKELVAVRFYDPDRSTAPPQEESEYKYFREQGDDLILNFGKHRGRSVDTVIEEFPDYVQWVLGAEWDNASMGEEVQRVFNEAMGFTADRDKPEKQPTGTMPFF